MGLIEIARSSRFWCKNELNDNNIDFDIKQINNLLNYFIAHFSLNIT